MFRVVGRHGFAVTLALSVLVHAAVAVGFSLDATEPPVALPSLIGKASMSIRASRPARPRIIGDGGATLKIVQPKAADPKPPPAPLPPAPVKPAEKKPPEPIHKEPSPPQPPHPPAAVLVKKPLPKPTAPSLGSVIKQKLTEWAALIPPPPKKTAPVHEPEKPFVPMPPSPKAVLPPAEAKAAPPAPPPPPKPAKDQDAPASKNPPTGLTPGSPALPKTEDVKEVADEASPSSRGSLGSEGVEADGLPVGLAVNPPPPYPAKALAAGLEGRVVLWVKIDASGRVSSIHIHESSGVQSLDDSALNTIQRWRFQPATRRGTPVPFEFLKPVSFSIAGR